MALEAVREAISQHLADAAELLADEFRLAREGFQDDVLAPLRIDEVAAMHLGRGLEFAIDPAVALFQHGWVPGQIEMEQVATPGLKVYALTRGIGAQQDPQLVLVGVGVEPALQILTPIGRCYPGEGSDAVIWRQVVEQLQQAALQPEPRRLPLCEDHQAALVPATVGGGVGPDPIGQLKHACVGVARSVSGQGQHGLDLGAVGDGCGRCRCGRRCFVVLGLEQVMARCSSSGSCSGSGAPFIYARAEASDGGATRSRLRRWTASVCAKAAGEDSRRCCSPMNARRARPACFGGKAAARARRASP